MLYPSLRLHQTEGFLKTSRNCFILKKQTRLNFATMLISVPLTRRDVRQTELNRSVSWLTENERVFSCVNVIGTIFYIDGAY